VPLPRICFESLEKLRRNADLDFEGWSLSLSLFEAHWGSRISSETLDIEVQEVQTNCMR
jgi:hypothetical protein